MKLTPEQRAKAMRANRGRTKPELRLARELWRCGARYLTPAGFRALYGQSLIGQPDLIFRGPHTVVFLDGCFWHGCPKCHDVSTFPVYWAAKVLRNKQRDQLVNRQLRSGGWRVLRV